MARAPPARQEAWGCQVESLGGKIPLKENAADFSSVLLPGAPWTEKEAGGQAVPHGIAKSQA